MQSRSDSLSAQEGEGMRRAYDVALFVLFVLAVCLYHI
jgi:hypothetical protein